MRVVLVTGSRRWNQLEPVQEALAGAEKLIVGDATGADELALQTALAWDIIPVVFTASDRRADQLEKEFRGYLQVIRCSDWDKKRDGDGAGPKRNGFMGTHAKIDRIHGFDVDCHAFPLEGSVGTWNCVRQLAEAGFAATVHQV